MHKTCSRCEESRKIAGNSTVWSPHLIFIPIHQLFRIQYNCFWLGNVIIYWWICIHFCRVWSGAAGGTGRPTQHILHTEGVKTTMTTYKHKQTCMYMHIYIYIYTYMYMHIKLHTEEVLGGGSAVAAAAASTLGDGGLRHGYDSYCNSRYKSYYNSYYNSYCNSYYIYTRV